MGITVPRAMPRWSMLLPHCTHAVVLQPCRQVPPKPSRQSMQAPPPRRWSGCGRSPEERALELKVWLEPVKLDEIVDHKRQEIAERERRHGFDEVMQRVSQALPPRQVHFKGDVALIAEVKRRSPSAGDLSMEVDPVAQA